MKFDARVVGVPNHLANARRYLSRSDFTLEQAKLKSAEIVLAAGIAGDAIAVEELFRRRAECVSHFRCERFNFLLPLQQFAAFIDGTTPEEVVHEGAESSSLQIIYLGQNDSLVVPIDFPEPLEIEVDGRPYPYMVCSGPRISAEIDRLDEYVAVKETMGVRQFDAFVDIERAAMERFEKHEGVGRRFWAKWGVLALRGVVSRSVEANVPLFIDPNFGEVPAVV